MEADLKGSFLKKKNKKHTTMLLTFDSFSKAFIVGTTQEGGDAEAGTCS